MSETSRPMTTHTPPNIVPIPQQPPQQPSSAIPSTNSAPSSQTPGHPSFRRQRASRACETCHARKVRCDAASLGVPCTNCVAFSIECKIPTPKRKKGQTKAAQPDSHNDDDPHDSNNSPATVAGSPLGPGGIPAGGPAAARDKTTVLHSSDGIPSTTVPDGYAQQQVTHNGTYTQFMKPKFARAPIKEAGRVAYLGESSNLSLLVQDRHGSTDVVHYPLPENVRGTRARMNELDNLEIEILHQRGAFLLPPRALCDELVEAFFKWVAPVVPVINRSRFMRRYRDSKNPPSLLLLQAILLAGSRVCANPQLMDASGSTTPAAMTFYKRAKALFDANYEDDRVTIVQALVLMGWYWEGPEGKKDLEKTVWNQSDIASDVTKNVFYWTRIAIVVAQGAGMHRSVESSQLSRSDKRLWKRIWWTLFSRDRSVAVALGRPIAIDPNDTDVEMVSEDDFIEDEEGKPAEYNPDPVHVQFFLNYVKLTEIMGLVLSQQYSVASKSRRNSAIDLTHSDMALADWLQNCPKEVSWERHRHHFWSALLHSNYYTTLCLLHRAHMPPASSPKASNDEELTAYPSRNIAYQAAGMITSIIEKLQEHDELRFTPAFIVYSLFSALIMHVYQMRSSNKSIVSATEQRLQICMTALKDVSKVWLVAKMVHTLFESILGNKVLEERLQRAAGKRHHKSKANNQSYQQAQQPQQAVSVPAEAPKRKFDDMEMGFSNGHPAPQVSYERSRPQTPAVTPSKELPPSLSHQGQTNTASPGLRQTEGYIGGTGFSRGNTRPTTPFNPSYSYPGTPPDLFLVTRNSPNISEHLWQNFQPDQLFPAETNVSFSQISPNPQNAFIDPQLRGPPHHAMQSQPHVQGIQQPPLQHPHQQQMPTMAQIPQQGNVQMAQMMPQHMAQPPQTDPNSWAQLDAMRQAGGGEDTWSNSSRSQGGPIVPTTLNVEDWFQFFGINGDLSHMNGF